MNAKKTEETVELTQAECDFIEILCGLDVAEEIYPEADVKPEGLATLKSLIGYKLARKVKGGYKITRRGFEVGCDLLDLGDDED